MPLREIVAASFLLAGLAGQYDIYVDAGIQEKIPRFAEAPPKFLEAIDWFRSKLIMTRGEFDMLNDVAKARAFTVAHVTEDRVLRRLKGYVTEAVEDGLTLDDFRKRLKEYFDRAGLTELQDSHVETIFRTNIGDAYNAGRWAALHEPAIDEEVIAYTYINPLDERTSEVCRQLAGKTYPKEDPVWLTYWPPNHFRCRSTALPKFRGERFRAAGAPALLPDEGFRRNSATADPAMLNREIERQVA